MDRRTLSMALMLLLGLGFLAAPGCRSLRPDRIPPEKPYYGAPTSSVTGEPPAVGFSSDPPMSAFGGAAAAAAPTPGAAPPASPAVAESVPAPDPLMDMPGIETGPPGTTP